MPQPHEFPHLENIEKQIRADVADALRSARHKYPKLGITVFVATYGTGGGFAYGSTVAREDMVRALIEFLHKEGLKGEDPEIQILAAKLYTRTRRPGDES